MQTIFDLNASQLTQAHLSDRDVLREFEKHAAFYRLPPARLRKLLPAEFRE